MKGVGRNYDVEARARLGEAMQMAGATYRATARMAERDPAARRLARACRWDYLAAIEDYAAAAPDHVLPDEIERILPWLVPGPVAAGLSPFHPNRPRIGADAHERGRASGAKP